MNPLRRLVLIGAGHAHLHVVRSFAHSPPQGLEVWLFSPAQTHIYSGMLPGYVGGDYPAQALTFDVSALAGAARINFVPRPVIAIDGPQRELITEDGRFPFDVASVDAGSGPHAQVPQHDPKVFSVRPIASAMSLRDRLVALARDLPAARLAIVGGGAAGVELALAADRAMRARDAHPEITVFQAGSTLLPGYGTRAGQMAESLLGARGIKVRLNTPVSDDGGDLRLANGTNLRFDLTIWVGGPAPPALLQPSRVPKDDVGYFLVDECLRAIDGSPVWGAGDCVTLRHAPWVPKAGVYAVREAAILDHNLRAAVAGKSPRAYRPQSRFLSILNTGEGKALLTWNGIAIHSRWAWWLKDRIDRRFMQRYFDVTGQP